MSGATDMDTRADALHRAFDQAFAALPTIASAAGDAFLAIRVAGEPYAVRLRHTAGVDVDRKVVALPGPMPECLGIAGLRGNLSAVFDLGALLGYPVAAPGRWLLLVGTGEIFALAISGFEGYLRATSREIVAREDGAPRHHVHAVIHAPSGVRPIIDLDSLLETIKRRVGSVHR